MPEKSLISQGIIESKIIFIRDTKVMIDKDLSALYGVETKVLNQAVKRNLMRFPNDFMFQLTKEEFENLLRSQFVTLKRGEHSKYLPYVFTENGIAMLSSVLKSKRAITINIQIMRTFTKLRKMLSADKKLRQKIEEIENKYDTQFKIVFDAIRQIISPAEKPKKRIGFSAKEKRAKYLAKRG